MAATVGFSRTAAKGRLLVATTDATGAAKRGSHLRRAADDALIITTSTAGATIQNGFLRSPTGALVVTEDGASPALVNGHYRHANGSLAVTRSVPAAPAPTVGFVRDSSGRLVYVVPYSAAGLDLPGLAGYWRVDEAAGPTAADTQGSNPGAYAGSGITYAQAGALPSGPSLAPVFDGTTGNIVLPGPIVTAVPLTLAVWIHLTTVTQRGLALKVGTEGPSGGAGGNGVGIGVGGATMDATGNNLLAIFESVRWIVGPSFGGTGWFHIAIVVDATGVAQLYLNGAPVATPTGANMVAPATKGYIGGYSGWNGAVAAPRFLNDSVDKPMVFSTALTAAQVLALYNSR